jgi:Type I restriction enzyme R protein N terminus (HSDR_N)
MSSSKFTDDLPSNTVRHVVKEEQIEYGFIGKLQNLKYEYRSDIRDRAALERNFCEKFEALNRVKLSDGEFARLLDEIVTPDLFTAAKTLRSINAFTREDGTPLNYTLVNIKDWCRNTFEVVNQLRINTDYSHHRYDMLILINGVPRVQIELRTLGINPRRAMEQIVDYKTTLAMATPRRCWAFCSSSSSATAPTPTTSPTTTPATLRSMPTNAFCPFTSSRTRPTTRSPSWTSLPTSSSSNAPWAKPSAATWCWWPANKSS